MKYHRFIVQTVLTALVEIFAENRYADKVIEFHLKKNKKWGARDRRFFAENVYDIVRHWRKLWNLAGYPDSDFLVPSEITEEKLWKVWGVYLLTHGQELPDWNEVRGINASEISKREQTLTPAQKYSWLDEMWDYAQEQGRISGKKADFEILNQIAPVFLRPNFLKVSSVELVSILAKEDVAAEIAHDKLGTVKLLKRQNVFITKAFKDGLFEVQDIASQFVGPFLDPQPGERVIDACAGAGGKTLQLGSLMKNRGKIIALDIHQWKLDELRKRAQRNGLDIVDAKVIEGTKTIKRLHESADRVLLDVPCSGSGVLRRNPDSKWKMSIPQIEELLKTQAEILAQYSLMVKPGGVLVYSTCSFFASEDEAQVEKFLQASQDWKCEEQLRLMPGDFGGDGFFMARLRRQKS